MLAMEEWIHCPAANFGTSSGNKSTKSGALAAGIAYHKKFYSKLRKWWDEQDVVDLEDWELHIEPWFRTHKWKQRSPDAVIVNKKTSTAIVIEAKLNWKEGRDVKLLDEYLVIVKSAFKLDNAYPLIVTGNIRGLKHPPLLGLHHILAPLQWTIDKPTPTMLVVIR